MSKHIILFLATNPLGSTELGLSREARAIQEELERSGQRDRFEFVTRWAVQPLDLLRELRKLKPTVVHFSGHGGRPRRDVMTELGVAASADEGGHYSGLLFQGPDGKPRLVTEAALRETFGAAGTSVRLLVLNVCCSGMQAEAFLVHIDCVIVVGCSLPEDMARAFAIGFYGGLGERQSVAAAYLQGCAAISLEAPSAFETPQLRVRDGVDADGLILAEINEEILELRGRLHERGAEFGNASNSADRAEGAADKQRRSTAKRRRWWMHAVPSALAAVVMVVAVLLTSRPAEPLALNPLGVPRLSDRRLPYRELRPDQGGMVGRRDPLGALDDRDVAGSRPRVNQGLPASESRRH